MCVCVKTYTTASGDGDLDGVSPDLADVFEVERLVGRFVLSPVNVEWSGVDRHLDAGRPIGIHGSVFVVEAFQLQLQVVSTISFLKKEKKKKVVRLEENKKKKPVLARTQHDITRRFTST